MKGKLKFESKHKLKVKEGGEVENSNEENIKSRKKT